LSAVGTRAFGRLGRAPVADPGQVGDHARCFEHGRGQPAGGIAWQEPLGVADRPDRSDRVTRVIEDRGGQAGLAEHGLVALAREPQLAHRLERLAEGLRPRVRLVASGAAVFRKLPQPTSPRCTRHRRIWLTVALCQCEWPLAVLAPMSIANCWSSPIVAPPARRRNNSVTTAPSVGSITRRPSGPRW
jgi:hypothetical protein